MAAELHILRESPLLNDIPGQLRALAKAIEDGEEPSVSAFLILPVPNEFPRVFGFGDVTGDYHPIVQFELAKAFLTSNLTERFRG